MNCSHTYKYSGINEVTCVSCGHIPQTVSERFIEKFGYLAQALDYYISEVYMVKKKPGGRHLHDILSFIQEIEKEAYERGRTSWRDAEISLALNEARVEARKEEREKLLERIEGTKQTQEWVDAGENTLMRQQHRVGYNKGLSDLQATLREEV